MGAARRGAAGGVLLHVHDAALARGRQQGAPADNVELPGGRVSRAVHARRTGDAPALDGHRLHRPRRSPGRSHLSASRAALRSAAWSVLVVAPFFVLGAALATSCGFFVYGRYVRPETLFVAAIATGFALSLSGVMEGRRQRVL